MDRDELANAYIAGVRDFAGADLSGVNLKNFTLIGVNFSKCIFTNSHLQEIDWRDNNFSGANLSCANLSDSNITNVNLTGANLQDANLSRTLMIKIDLTRANLQGAVLGEATFEDVVLREANLTGAYGADMTTFKRVNFQGAILNDFDFASCTKLNIIMPDGSHFTERWYRE